MTSPPPAAKPRLTPGFRPVLVAEPAFERLRTLQLSLATPTLRFDLMDIVTAVVELGLAEPQLAARVRDRAREAVRQRLDKPEI